MYLSIIFLPILGSILAGLRGRTLGITGSQYITTSCLIVSALLSLVAFYEVALCRSSVSINLGSWIDCEYLVVNWSFLFDDLTVSMIMPVLIVSSLVHIYSMSYMSDDPHGQRFFSYLSIFTGFMLILVTGDSYLTLFVGWEGIGMSSFLLIGFWLTRVQANKAAIKALTINRVGDMSLSIGFFAMVWVFGNLEYSNVLALAPLMNETAITIIGLLFLGGAMAKSAQVPLQTWLADAMEGPTPVSALIHAATLVTAGVYLILRSAPLLEYGPTTLMITGWIGALTAFFAATTGLVQSDLKRVIAYSTCSQIGYLFMGLGINQYSVALYHLVNHAFFKALLFLAAGAVIHGIADQQDLRRMGGLINFMPFTYTALLVGSLSLIAIPFLTGFYSKDAILELAAGTYTTSGTLVYWIGTLSAALTAFYSFRLLSLTFFITPAAPKNDYLNAHEAPILIVIPLFVLSVLSIVFGYLASDLFRGVGTDFLSSSFHLHPNNVALIDAEFGVSQIIKILPAIVSLGGAATALILYQQIPNVLIVVKETYIGNIIYRFLSGQWHWNSLVTGLMIRPSLSFGFVISKVIDRGVVETVGPYGLSNILPSIGQSVADYDTSLVTSYALYVILGLLSIILFLYAPFYGSSTYTANSDLGLILIYLVGIALLPSIKR